MVILFFQRHFIENPRKTFVYFVFEVVSNVDDDGWKYLGIQEALKLIKECPSQLEDGTTISLSTYYKLAKPVLALNYLGVLEQTELDDKSRKLVAEAMKILETRDWWNERRDRADCFFDHSMLKGCDERTCFQLAEVELFMHHFVKNLECLKGFGTHLKDLASNIIRGIVKTSQSFSKLRSCNSLGMSLLIYQSLHFFLDEMLPARSEASQLSEHDFPLGSRKLELFRLLSSQILANELEFDVRGDVSSHSNTVMICVGEIKRNYDGGMTPSLLVFGVSHFLFQLRLLEDSFLSDSSL
jgi:hypothetical protein